uniref:Uncharacterized protein n=1 Tax=Arundo donax TaxID=35708 RepID=A0A0A8Z9I0_ARUDO
MCRPKNIN